MYEVHNPKEQALLDEVSELKKYGNATWSEIAHLLSKGSGKHITRASAYKIVRRERYNDVYAESGTYE